MTDSNRARLHQLLQERIEYPEREREVDTLIHQIFDQDCAILVLDLCGFSRLTIRHGIIHFLAMVHRMTAIAEPLVTHHKGRVIKQEADNLFAVFPDVTMAVNAAVDILKGFAAVNTGLPDDKDLHASIGIGYGTTLVIGDSDLYGSEMNLASKLGEDLAQQNEILLTEEAFKQLSNKSDLSLELLSFSVSGLSLVAYALRN
ncbi:MAG: adenylate/guanylate cyclase domain-containing protein [Leptolyngbya sp.]|nr:MAG: adenylate/guanylate cyclase domain-containing protein [Leptolyngbya sp.]